MVGCPAYRLCCSASLKAASSDRVVRLVLFHVVARHQLRLRLYADDSQVYVSTPANDAAAAVARLSACIASRLRLNPCKTEVMWLGTSQQLDKIAIKMCRCCRPS